MSNPPLQLLTRLFLYSFELSGPFDEHQEQNARLKTGRLLLAQACAVAR
jgi:hypothetical protein